MAVQKLRNKPASIHLMTKIFGQIDPGKTPMWGKPVRERNSSYFINSGNYTSAKLKPADI